MRNEKKTIEKMTVGFGALTLLFFLMNAFLPWDGWFPFFVTAATTFYHFAVRLLVGAVTRNHCRNLIRAESRWFLPRQWENRLYEALGVKQWKNRMPTYFPKDFSLKEHTPEEVVQNMCIAEVGHEINVICSFLPLLYSLCQPRLRGEWYIFAITGILALGADVPFILIQRYNRPRVLRLQAAWEKRKQKEGEKNHAVEL